MAKYRVLVSLPVPVAAFVEADDESDAKLKGLGWSPAHPDSIAAVPEVIDEIRGSEQAAGSS